MTTVDPKSYQPRIFDICIQEIGADHFTNHRYEWPGPQWVPHGSLSEAEKQSWTASWKLIFVGEGEGKRQYYRFPYLQPQFPDESGWSLVDKKAPYFYEHITLAEPKRLKLASARRLYKIVMIYPGVEYHHKNTYFVKGSHLNRFFQDHIGSEQLVSIELIQHMPSTSEKLT